MKTSLAYARILSNAILIDWYRSFAHVFQLFWISSIPANHAALSPAIAISPAIAQLPVWIAAMRPANVALPIAKRLPSDRPSESISCQACLLLLIHTAKNPTTGNAISAVSSATITPTAIETSVTGDVSAAKTLAIADIEARAVVPATPTATKPVPTAVRAAAAPNSTCVSVLLRSTNLATQSTMPAMALATRS